MRTSSVLGPTSLSLVYKVSHKLKSCWDSATPCILFGSWVITGKKAGIYLGITVIEINLTVLSIVFTAPIHHRITHLTNILSETSKQCFRFHHYVFAHFV